MEGDLFEPVAKEKFDLTCPTRPTWRARTRVASSPSCHTNPRWRSQGPTGSTDPAPGGGSGDYSGGWLGIELSPEQVDEVEGLLSEAGFTDVERRFDLASRPRVVAGRWSKRDIDEPTTGENRERTRLSA